MGGVWEVFSAESEREMFFFSGFFLLLLLERRDFLLLVCFLFATSVAMNEKQ